MSDEPTAPRQVSGPAREPTTPRRRTRRELHQPPQPAGALLDFRQLAARLQTVAGVLALATLVAIVVDGLRNGLSFAIMGRWIGLYVAVLLAVAAVSVALHALAGLGAAGRRGERLSGDDVRLVPPVPTRRRRR